MIAGHTKTSGCLQFVHWQLCSDYHESFFAYRSKTRVDILPGFAVSRSEPAGVVRTDFGMNQNYGRLSKCRNMFADSRNIPS